MDDFLIILFVFSVTILIILLSIKIIFTEPSKEIGIEREIKEYIKTGLYEDAEFLIKIGLKKNPSNKVLRYWQAEVEWLKDNKITATEIFENLETIKWGKKKKYKQHILFRLASWYKERKMLDKAWGKTEELIHLNDAEPEYKILIGEIFLARNNPEQALIYFKQALELDPQNVLIWKTMAEIYTSLSHIQDAFDAYINVININPQDKEIWFKLGDISVLMKENEQAIKFYSKAEYGNTVLSFNASYNIGKLLLENNNTKEGYVSLEKALLKITPETVSLLDQSKILSARYTVAEYYLENNRIDLALKEWAKILNTNPLYLNVKEMFHKYSELYLDDLFKDLLTHTGEELVAIVFDFVVSLGFQVESFTTPEPEEINIIAYHSGKKRNKQFGKIVFSFWCSTIPLPSNFATHLQKHLENIHTSKIYIISAGPVFSELRQILEQRSIEIFDKNNIQELINANKKN